MRFLHTSTPRTQTPKKLRPRACRNSARVAALVALLFLAATASQSIAQTVSRFDSTGTADSSGSAKPNRKRIVKLRRDSATAPLFTLAADSSISDYRSFADGDRFSVLIPRSALATAQNIQSGPGFSDLRLEQRGDDVVLSFHLQQGASVSVNQNFNRLDVAFNTNEEPGKRTPEKADKELPARPTSPD